MNIAIEDNQVVVTRPSDEKEHRALHGLTRALINNMVIGVTKGYQKTLELVGVGYRAAITRKEISIKSWIFTSSWNRCSRRNHIWNSRC